MSNRITYDAMPAAEILQQWGPAVAVAAAVAVFVGITLKPLIAWLKRRAILDIPNERSSHVEIVPRGGGIAVTAGILLGLGAYYGVVLPMPADGALAVELVMLSAAALAGVSWLDDRLGGLPVLLRLGVQVAAIGTVLIVVLPDSASVTQGLVPVWLERIVLFLAWVWFTNLFNFMDGINGITSVEMIGVGLGGALLAAMQSAVDPIGLIVAAAALGFLPWNWGRAKVFLGDVGSVPVGYLLGGLLLGLAVSGAWAAALILPMYYWMDATITLLRRLSRGEKVWQAHRSHFYQQGARKLGSHAAVAGRIAALNLLLVGLAVLSLQGVWAALGAILAAVILTAALCRHFADPA